MKKAFMIMQIGNPELDDMYESIYRSIAQECGLRIFRVDKDNEGDLIKKTIDKYIEEAEIIIADLTNERPSCYHEVGYAYGLRKYLNVVLTVREDHLPASDNFNNKGPKIHFDLNDYPIFPWKKEKINEFEKILTQEIKRRLSEIEKKGSMGASIKKDNEGWFLNHSSKALNEFKKFEGKGFIEVNVYSDSIVSAFRPDKIRDVIMNLKNFRNRFPLAYLAELNTSPYKWKLFQNEIIKDFVIDNFNNSCFYAAVRKDLFFFILNSFTETDNVEETLYMDTRVHNIIHIIQFIQDLYKKFQLKDQSVLNIKVKYYNLNNFKLLTSFEREIGKELHPFTTSGKNISSEINVRLNDIDSNLVKVVQDLLTDFFIVYDAAEYLDKQVPEIVNNYMKKNI